MKTISPRSLAEFVAESTGGLVRLRIDSVINADVVESILRSPEVGQIGGLDWRYAGGTVPARIGDLPLPRLVELELGFHIWSELDWLAQALPNYPNLRKLSIHTNSFDTNPENFFRRLGKSLVDDLEIDLEHWNPTIEHALAGYLMGDRLRRLVVWGGGAVPTPKLCELELRYVGFTQPLVVSGSVRRLVLWCCRFVPDDAFESLTLSNLEELAIWSGSEMLGSALVRLLDRRNLDRLELRSLGGRTMSQLGARLGRVGVLELWWSSEWQMALGLGLGDPDSRIRELRLWSVEGDDLPSIWPMLIGSRVEKLRIEARESADRPACARMEERYNTLMLLLALRPCRFPVEMMRLAALMLYTQP